MRLDRFAVAFVIAGAVGILGGCAAMEEGGDEPAPPEDPMAKMMAEMQAWMTLHAPNENHEWLRAGAGSFECTGTMWPAPGMEPMPMTGRSEVTPILEGRYIREDFQGEFMGEPFAGMALVGYDNQEKEFFSIWVDGMSTNYMVSRGHMREDGVLEMSGDMPMPDGTTSNSRMLLRRTDDGGMVMEMYMTKPGEEEFKHMEFTYTKKR